MFEKNLDTDFLSKFLHFGDYFKEKHLQKIMVIKILKLVKFENHLIQNLYEKTTSIKFKSILYAVFQTPNSVLIQKSIKHVDAFEETNNEYKIKRAKNNESVRKSRAKNREKIQDCAENVKELKKENVLLNQKLGSLQSELLTLKGLFQHCFSFNLNNLAIKPSDIPTSTLSKIIMKNERIMSSQIDQSILPINEIDSYYMDQFNNALSTIAKNDSK